jgi:Fructose-2,6-bisphosphatase
MSYQIYLVRHGQTWLNRYNSMQGWSDTPLTPEGIDVARKTADHLKDIDFAAAISSDTKRAVDTCKIITDKNEKKIKSKEMPEFREQFYGYFEGRDKAQAWYAIGQPHGANDYLSIAQKFGIDATMNFVKQADPFSDAESAIEFWNRIHKGFEKLDELANDDDKILLVTHSTTIFSLAYRYHAKDVVVDKLPDNSSLTILNRNNGQNRIISYDQSF